MKLIRLLSLLFLLLLCVLLCSCRLSRAKRNIPYSELGIPASEQYADGITARSPWDMIVWNGYLYVGLGDFDANAGPIGIPRLNLQTSQWENGAPLPEEECNRFRMIDGRLTFPGIDPKESWELGNYYVLENSEWIQQRVIPNGVHTFDMAETDGLIFASLGVPAGDSPFAVSDDGGKTFRPVEMVKDDRLIDTSEYDLVRSYDLFVLGGKVYATFLYQRGTEHGYELYRYEDGRFTYDNDWLGKVRRMSITYKLIFDQAVLNDRLYLATGALYVTKDMNEISRIKLPNSEIVYDVAVENGQLYALCGVTREDGSVLVSVWKQTREKSHVFSRLFDFTYPIPPLSFALRDGVFYIGMSDTVNQNEKNGMILQIAY